MLKIESCGEWPSLRLTKLSGFIIEVGLGEGWRRVGGGLGGRTNGEVGARGERGLLGAVKGGE